MRKIDIIIDGSSYVNCTNNYLYLDEMFQAVKNSGMSMDVTFTNKDLYGEDKLNKIASLGVVLTGDDISSIVSKKIKARDKEHALVVLSISNYALDVNKNNNSHYIYMDSYLTDAISINCLKIIGIDFKGVNLIKKLDK